MAFDLYYVFDDRLLVERYWSILALKLDMGDEYTTAIFPEKRSSEGSLRMPDWV